MQRVSNFQPFKRIDVSSILDEKKSPIISEVKVLSPVSCNLELKQYTSNVFKSQVGKLRNLIPKHSH